MPVVAPPGGGKAAKPKKPVVTHHTAEKAKKPSLSKADKAKGKLKPAVHPAPPGGGGKVPKPKAPSKLSDLDKFLWAEGEQESGNNYLATNPTSGALGRWQVMPDNLPKWLPESGYPVMSPNAFLHNDKAQIAVANKILGGYFKEYGAAGAASMWYSGQPNPNESFGQPSVRDYVNDVLKLMGSSEVEPIAASGSSVVLPWDLPKVQKNDSWSGQVRESATVLSSAGRVSLNYATAIQRTYRK
jgi:hypothetical protein